MSLSYCEQRQLRGIEARLLGSEPHLAGMLEMFGRLYRGQDMPASEQVASRQGSDRRAAKRTAAAFSAVAVAICVMFSAAVSLIASVRRVRHGPSAAQPGRTRSAREAGRQHDPPG